ncbi:hypothetical protein [Burkholderia lata]|uniref:hypothetical protein n=1 Tax=Burkholderia lata (strain ATCC 17760 / DSM 23089 / LMG 22485 / NCIMB 9086 / R18194 / 383) TaxID=482957 RepID=UPI0015814B8D|nr:hypothetical protein [Burkholderia lata]
MNSDTSTPAWRPFRAGASLLLFRALISPKPLLHGLTRVIFSPKPLLHGLTRVIFQT